MISTGLRRRYLRNTTPDVPTATLSTSPVAANNGQKLNCHWGAVEKTLAKTRFKNPGRNKPSTQPVTTGSGNNNKLHQV